MQKRDGQSVREFAMEVAELRRKAGISGDHRLARFSDGLARCAELLKGRYKVTGFSNLNNTQEHQSLRGLALKWRKLWQHPAKNLPKWHEKNRRTSRGCMGYW
ncbi:hypothetical protein T10_8013 [Trichinella papuae]|uniref:Uncharacterized protein n=1 Tax=Trichinella papuae TaxID=268474 RepID=A0A0V1MHG9_9BILA|nr:hypothetical protein T10_8013 [Trichinella papuae]